VSDLHRFFVAWMTGGAPRNAATFARFVDVVADGFALISPSGVITERAPLIAELEAAHGARKGQGFQIRVRNFRQRHTACGLCLVTYEEWQDLAGSTTGRLSSAWFRAREGTPHGVEWLHVHETWLPGAGA
jgi:hypothetical protein